MYSLVICMVALVVGYFIYGKFIEKVFGIDPQRKTPCYTNYDDVDFKPLPTWKVFLIQFLNIAGTGPIFGAILGILYGPAAYLWIVFGCIFAGAVHDYLSGMMSLRQGGASQTEIVVGQLGHHSALIVRLLTFALLFMVTTVFVSTPASLLNNLSGEYGFWGSVVFWQVMILAYYLLATLLPINALIGRIYPLFGAALLIMAVGVGVGIFTHSGWMPELTECFGSHHPTGLAILPMMFITIACGAISGFHATQSPMMARCLKNERMGRPVFYGAMITEGMIALIWAAAAIKYTGSYEGLYEQMKGNPAIIVNAICHDWMGQVGAVLAILGVVAAPITTGDTAMRSARLVAADSLHIEQRTFKRRIMLALPMALLCAFFLTFSFDVLWRYMGWLNQTLSVFTLFAIALWLRRSKRFCWVAAVPAVFMTFICTSYIIVCPTASGGLGLPAWLAYTTAGILCAVCLWMFARVRL